MAFLIFNLLDSPCIAAITTLAREMNDRRWTAFALAYQNIFAYVISLMVYQFAGLLTGAVSFGPGTITALGLLALIVFLIFRREGGKVVTGGLKYEHN